MSTARIYNDIINLMGVRFMQALMLAAGMGKRLGKYTKNNTKCMLEIQGKTLIERAIEALLESGVTKIVIVVGYKGDNLKKFLTEECTNPKIRDMEIEFVDNDVYDKTNNIKRMDYDFSVSSSVNRILYSKSI